jgi:hypothetical protein
MRPQTDIDAAAYDDRMLEELAKKSRAARELVESIKAARKTCRDAELDADFDESGKPFFTRFQTAKAVRHTREDVSASLLLQVIVSSKLDRNKNFMWAIIALLLYIASRLN